MYYLTTHSTHFIYGYITSDTWYRTTQIAREESRCRHMGYTFRLSARVLLYASHIQDNTYHGLCYTSRGSLAGTRRKKEGNVLFKYALNRFYLWLYDVGHLVKDNWDSQRGKPLPPMSSKKCPICISPQTGWHIPRHLLQQSWSTGPNRITHSETYL